MINNENGPVYIEGNLSHTIDITEQRGQCFKQYTTPLMQTESCADACDMRGVDLEGIQPPITTSTT